MKEESLLNALTMAFTSLDWRWSLYLQKVIVIKIVGAKFNFFCILLTAIYTRKVYCLPVSGLDPIGMSIVCCSALGSILVFLGDMSASNLFVKAIVLFFEC